eukprot:TRINITY_DN100011_c0_g1_i1.p1 TRINITY_DN100011_c0_g1~~TRINITY_DN100011_c0_g1_i1.p1  ORF type:complete len:164 (-),score=35.33 TRINITY_DN100011_c0_g1_i1:88-579(-)
MVGASFNLSFAGWLLMLSLASSGQQAASAFQNINAVTFATSSMADSYDFYSKLGMRCTFGGPTADFTTFGSAGGPQSGDNSYHVNLFVSARAPSRDKDGWNGVGRTIFYVTDVDSLHSAVTAAGLRPEFAPKDADWGERYFQILDPMGNELSFAKPIEDVQVV